MSKPSKNNLFAVPRAAKIRLSILLIALAIFGIWGWNISTNPSSLAQAENQAKLLQTIYTNGNYLEAIIWELFAVGFAILAAKTTKKVRQHRLIATVTFCLFGLSDVVEVQTGAWWHHWWLFLWKSSCVISMVGLLVVHLRDRSE
jgi:hypothetical protein